MPPKEDFSVDDESEISYIGYGIYLGSYWDAKKGTALERRGITHVLTLGWENHSDYEKASRVKHNVYQVRDTGDADWSKLFKDEGVLGFIEDFLGYKNNRLFVHCTWGVIRSSFRRPRHPHQVQELHSVPGKGASLVHQIHRPRVVNDARG